MIYFQNFSPRLPIFYGESLDDLALMPTTTKIGEGEYIPAVATEGSYAFILTEDGLQTFRLRSTGWIETTKSGGGGGGGSDNYRDLSNKPSINNVILTGNKTSKDLKLLTKDQVYHYGATINFSQLPVITEETVNGIYTIKDKFTTTANFVTGAGIKYRAGASIALVNLGTNENPNYKYSIISGTLEYDSELSDSSENAIQTKVIKSLLDQKANNFQVNSLPTASAELVGNTVQYTGPDNELTGLRHNYFYECIEDDTTDPPTYKWEGTKVSPDSGSEPATISPAELEAMWNN